MRNFLKNYKMSLILLLSVVVGGIIGAVWGPKAQALEPFGQIFLNLLYVVIVPLVFFSVSSAVANMNGMGRLGRIIMTIVAVFLITAFLSVLLGMAGALAFNPTKGLDAQAVRNILSQAGGAASGQTESVSLLKQLVNTLTVGDFTGLLSKSNMLQIIVFALIFGIATALVGEKAAAVKNLLNVASSIFIKMVDVIMYYAPIGLACYFASVIGQLGAQIFQEYLKVFLLYLVLTAIYYFVFFSGYAYLSAGKAGFKAFWRNIIPPTVTALATCSSAATLPVNLESTKKIGVSEDIAETVIPLGVNTHKDGSALGGVLKIVFLFGLFGKDLHSIPMLLSVFFVSLLVGAVMGAIPGGGMIGEMLIISVYGFPPEAFPIIAVIGTIIDAPATVLNSTGNTVSAMLVSRFVDGKKWLNKGETKEKLA